MGKIFRYECRRLLWNKFFIGLAVVLLLYGALVLHAVTILGVSHTAPFSPWSFGDYLSRMLPLLWIGMLFFLTFYTSPKARRAAVLMDATPMPPKQYALVRCAAALTGGVLLSLLCMGEAAVFYGRMFHWYGWGSLLLPALVTLLPALVFALGSGWLLGRLRPWLVYVWMAVPFLLAALPLPEVLSLWNGRFFTAYPLTLGTLDPAFALPAGAAAAQVVLLAVGAALLAAGGSRAEVIELAAPSHDIHTFGDIEIHPDRRVVLKAGEEVSLNHGEFSMLLLLASAPGQVFSKDQLYDAAWHEEYRYGTTAVENIIWRLRQKLEDDPRHPVYIKTVIRSGYKIEKPR